MKRLALLAIVGVLTQADIERLIDLGNRAEAAQVEKFWKKLRCARVVKDDKSTLVCIKDLEVYTLEEPRYEYK